jgi:hypothetical protein
MCVCVCVSCVSRGCVAVAVRRACRHSGRKRTVQGDTRAPADVLLLAHLCAGLLLLPYTASSAEQHTASGCAASHAATASTTAALAHATSGCRGRALPAAAAAAAVPVVVGATWCGGGYLGMYVVRGAVEMGWALRHTRSLHTPATAATVHNSTHTCVASLIVLSHTAPPTAGSTSGLCAGDAGTCAQHLRESPHRRRCSHIKTCGNRRCVWLTQPHNICWCATSTIVTRAAITTPLLAQQLPITGGSTI